MSQKNIQPRRTRFSAVSALLVVAGLGLTVAGLGERPTTAHAEEVQSTPTRAAAAMHAPVSMTMLDHELRATPVLVTAIELRPDGRGEIRMLEGTGSARERRVAFQDVAALAPDGFWSARGDERWQGTPMRARPGAAHPVRPIDEFGVERLMPALVQAQGRAGWIELTDGQVLAGVLARADATGERVAWSASWLLGAGEAELIAAESAVSFGFSIDRIRRIVVWPESFAERPLSNEEGVSDLVLLRNGDLLRGFVEGIASEPAQAGAAAGEEIGGGVRTRIAVESAGRVVQVPYESVAQVLLQSPAAPTVSGPSRPVARVVLTDGTSLLVGSISTLQAASAGQGATARLKLSVPALRSASIADDAGEPASVVVNASEVRSIVPIVTRLTPLSALSIVRHEPASDRRRSEAPVRPELSPREASGMLGAAPIGLDGPCVVEWALVGGSEPGLSGLAVGVRGERQVRFAGRVSLAPFAAPWGDCEVRLELIVEGGGSPISLATARLTGDRRSVTLSGQIPVIALGSSASGLGASATGSGGARLRLTVDAGEFGPIRDAVVLDEWLLLEGAGQP